jgi:hypothetical protein
MGKNCEFRSKNDFGIYYFDLSQFCTTLVLTGEGWSKQLVKSHLMEKGF